jgi:hypothetical protein
MSYLATAWKPDIYESDSFGLDGYNWRVAGDEAHSFKSDGTNYRFELRQGDRFSASYWTDSVGVERSEMGETSNHALSGNGSHFHATYKMMIEPGAKNTAQWLVTGQLFTGGTPPFEIKFMGNDKMAVVIKNGTSGSPNERTVYLDSADIQRGKWYDIEIDVQLDANGNNGHAYVWRDGTKIANYTGKIGYTNATESHWEMGAYRKSPSGGESFAVNYKDVDLTYGSGGHSDTAHSSPSPMPSPSPSPSPSPTPTLPTPNLLGTSYYDNLVGGSARDVINAKGGNDALYGRGGNDILVGGAGRDVFVFDTSPKSNVDKILDFVVGTDKIHVQNAVFSGGNVDYGSLPSSMFKIGAKATDSSDRFIYNKDTGSLYFDKDGTGSAAQVEFAKLGTNLKMTAADFFIL